MKRFSLIILCLCLLTASFTADADQYILHPSDHSTNRNQSGFDPGRHEFAKEVPGSHHALLLSVQKCDQGDLLYG